MIREKVVYETRGKQFDSEEKAIQYRDDLVGEFMDKVGPLLHPRDRLVLNKAITENRKVLIDLLSY